MKSRREHNCGDGYKGMIINKTIVRKDIFGTHRSRVNFCDFCGKEF